MIVIPIQSYPQAIKKVDLEEYIKKQAKGSSMGAMFGLIGLIIVQLIMLLFMMPRLLSLYETFGQSMPTYLPLAILASIAIGLVLIVVSVLLNPLDDAKVAQLKQQNDDLISVKGPIVNKNMLWLYWGYALIFFLAMGLVIILPIYSLSSSV